jgi:hypothetical protein
MRSGTLDPARGHGASFADPQCAGIERLGDTTVNTVLLGANLPFVTTGRNTVAGRVGGLEWRTREGISFFGAAEAIRMSDQSTVVSARGGIRAAW